MIKVNLKDNNFAENVKAVFALKQTGMFTDETLQKMYDDQVAHDNPDLMELSHEDTL